MSIPDANAWDLKERDGETGEGGERERPEWEIQVKGPKRPIIFSLLLEDVGVRNK